MKKWLLSLAAVTTISGSAWPIAFADSTASDPSNDHAYLYGDGTTPTLNTAMKFSLNFYSPVGNTSTLQLQTTLGSLNGGGSSTTLTPTNGTYPNFTLNSTVSGTATLTVYESGVLIGTTQVTFPSGTLTGIGVQATPTETSTGGNSTLTITANDSFGNPVADFASGTTFTVTTTQGQLIPLSGINFRTNGSNISNIGTHNGVARVLLTDSTAGTATVTITEVNTLSSVVTINGTPTTTYSIPITFSDPSTTGAAGSIHDSSNVTVQPLSDFTDTLASNPQTSAIRELSTLGVLSGYPNHKFQPNLPTLRSEFAAIVTRYMGVSDLVKTLSGTSTSFADVSADAWYDGAVAEVSILGYMKGDGTDFFPERSISYAEVSSVLLRNLGIPAVGSWPNGPLTTAQQAGLLKGVTPLFGADAPATRGDVAMMVTNALHTTLGGSTPAKTLEMQTLGTSWSGNAGSTITVSNVPASSTLLGNQLQVTTGGQTQILHLANQVQLSGADSLTALLGKNIHYLQNSLGLLTFIEVTP